MMMTSPNAVNVPTVLPQEPDDTVTESAPCAANEPQRLSFGFVCCGARLWTLNVDDFRDVPGLELFK